MTGRGKGAKGLGIGGAKRHRKIIRDAIYGITDPALQRLARRAGVKRISKLVYEELRGIVRIKLENVISDAYDVTSHLKKKTIGGNEVKRALHYRGVNMLYHEKKPKVTKTVKTGDDTKSKVVKTGDVPKKSHSDITLNTYIQRVLKQVHPNIGLNASSLSQINQYLMVLLERITDVAKELSYSDEKKTLTSRDVQSAVMILLPGELAKHAVSESTKAITKFNASLVSRGVRPKSKGVPNILRGKKIKIFSVGGRAARAGLTFSPSRIENLMRGIHKLNTNYKEDTRIGSGAPIYLAAVLEFIAAEILELAGNATKDYNRVRITSRMIFLATSGDEELDALSRVLGIVLAKGGVIPHIHKSLLSKK